MSRARKTATDVKIDFLVKEMKSMRTELQSVQKQINFGRGAVWILIFLGSIVSGIYNLLNR